MKVHINNAKLYESLSSPNLILSDNAHWECVTDGSEPLFTLTQGVSYLYIENTSDTEEALLNITGVAHA